MKLSADLAKITGKEVASILETDKLVWDYIRRKRLQDPENKMYFTPDANMAKIFGTGRMHSLSVTKLIRPHLSKI